MYSTFSSIASFGFEVYFKSISDLEISNNRTRHVGNEGNPGDTNGVKSYLFILYKVTGIFW